MKAKLKKKILIYPLIGLTLWVLFTPLYMYFSHDVARLNTEWPLRLEKSEPVKYEVQKKKPSNWVTLKDISPFAKWSIVLSEDWAFYQHEGIDVEQIKVALGEMVHEKKFRGASTITQQMVKNVYLSEDRTLWRKLHEMLLAQKVEKVLRKDRILEVYLNVIEFGPNVYGIREASYHYFRKHPSALGPKESAFLAMLLPSPKRYYISYKKKKLTPFARSRINKILDKLRMGKVISSERYQAERGGRLAWEQN